MDVEILHNFRINSKKFLFSIKLHHFRVAIDWVINKWFGLSSSIMCSPVSENLKTLQSKPEYVLLDTHPHQKTKILSRLILPNEKKIKTKTSDRYTSQSELAFQIVSIERGRKEWVRNHRKSLTEENLILWSECWLIYNPFGYPWCVDSESASSQKSNEKQKEKKVLVSRKRKSCNCVELTKVCLKKIRKIPLRNTGKDSRTYKSELPQTALREHLLPEKLPVLKATQRKIAYRRYQN